MKTKCPAFIELKWIFIDHVIALKISTLPSTDFTSVHLHDFFKL